MTASALVVTLLAVATFAVAVLLLAFRAEDDWARLWAEIVSPRAKSLRETIDVRLQAKECVTDARRASAVEADAAGTPLRAADLHALEAESERERQSLLLLRRMLSALRSR